MYFTDFIDVVPNDTITPSHVFETQIIARESCATRESCAGESRGTNNVILVGDTNLEAETSTETLMKYLDLSGRLRRRTPPFLFPLETPVAQTDRQNRRCSAARRGYSLANRRNRAAVDYRDAAFCARRALSSTPRTSKSRRRAARRRAGVGRRQCNSRTGSSTQQKREAARGGRSSRLVAAPNPASGSPRLLRRF